MWIKYRIRKRGGWSNYTYVLESIKAAEFVAFMKEEHMYDDNFFDIEAEDVEHPPKAWITRELKETEYRIKIMLNYWRTLKDVDSKSG